MRLLVVYILPIVLGQQQPIRGEIPGICKRPLEADARPPPIPPLHQTSRGPTEGSLMIVGGFGRERIMYDKMLELGGGPEAKIVFVPTNSGNQFDTPEQIETALANFRGLTGWQQNQISLIHTTDPQVANTTEFTRLIDEATIAWFGGGRQYRMADSYLYTLAQEAFHGILKRGGVIGGSSAGASIMGDVMVRGDSGGNGITVGDHLQGFAYTTNIGYDQHFLERNRQNDMVEFVNLFPNVLGLSIDEGTAILMQGDEFEVYGTSYVAVYDRTIWPTEDWCSNGLSFLGRPVLTNGQKIFYLSRGDRYNVRTREILSMRERFDEELYFY